MAARQPRGSGRAQRPPASRDGRRLPLTTVLVVVAALVGAALAVVSFSGSPTPVGAGARPSPAFVAPDPHARLRPSSGEAVADGTRVGFTITPGDAGPAPGELRLTLTDAGTGAPVDPASPPVVWADLQRSSDAPGGPAAQTCEEKARLFAQGRLGAGPDVDLNAYYVLTLNDDASISVIDPLADVGGMTQLFAMPTLSAPGEDWAFSADGRLLFVTMPEAGAVAVLDTATFEVVTEVDAGADPTTVAVAGDQVWVTGGGGPGQAGAVTVIDADELRTVATVPTGPDPMRVRFTGGSGSAADPHAGHAPAGTVQEPDGPGAAVVPHPDGSLSLVDRGTFVPLSGARLEAPIADVAVAPHPGAVYVALEGGHPVAVLDPDTLDVTGRLDGVTAVSTLAVAPGGRQLFALSPSTGTVSVVDTTSGAVVASGDVGMAADQVSFTDGHAYLRSAQEPRIGVVDLTRPGSPGELDAVRVTIGQEEPAGAGVADAAAPALAPVHGTEMLVANAADQYVYMYMPGMNAAMGGFQTYGRSPRAVTVVDRGLAREGPGAYTARLGVSEPGEYDLMVAVGDPAALHCFAFTADPTDPAAAGTRPVPVAATPADLAPLLPAGRTGELRFRLTDVDGRSVHGLTDVQLLAMAVAGGDDTRAPAEPGPDGTYAADLLLPATGRYTVWVTVPSLGLTLGDLDAFEVEAAP